MIVRVIVCTGIGLMIAGAGLAEGVFEPIGAKVISATARDRTSLSQLSWLAGCWKRTTARRVVEEQWMAPSAGLMLGVGRTTNAAGDTLVEFEQTRIEGTWEPFGFTATPSGQPTASFVSIESSDSVVVFENKAHDFPQRVGYRRMADGSLNGWIEGTKDGKTRHIDFPYRRVACPGSPK